MAESKSKRMRIKLTYGNQQLVIAHHVILVNGTYPLDGLIKVWFSIDTTVLPVEIEFTLPSDVKEKFHLLIMIENKFNRECVYISQKKIFDVNEVNQLVTMPVSSNN